MGAKFQLASSLAVRGPVHKSPEEFENCFSLKTCQVFSVHTSAEEFKRQLTISGHFNSGREVT